MWRIMHCLAVTILAVVNIAKFKFKIKNYGIVSGWKKGSTHDSSYFSFFYNFLLFLARKVSILGLATEWCDRIFQSIIVRGKNDNL